MIQDIITIETIDFVSKAKKNIFYIKLKGY
jgi:hypothetical protein